MSTPDDNLPPQTSKFFDIIPSSKRSSASPNSRPIITKKSPAQADSMINKDEQPDPIEIPSEQSGQPEAIVEPVNEVIEYSTDQVITETADDGELQSDEETPPPVQTDIEETKAEEQPQVTELNNESESDEKTPPPVQTDIERTLDETANEELLLPAEATPDEVTSSDAVVIHSPETSKSFRLRTWLIALLFVIIIAIIALVLYLFVFKANATITPNTQIFGN